MKKNLLSIFMAFFAFQLHAENLPVLTDDAKITPIAGPRVENGADVFITADLIYWDMTQKGLSFAESIPISGDQTQGRIFYPEFNFDAGFQVGLGLQLGHDGWDIYTNYTWFHPETHSKSFQDESLDLSYTQVGNPNKPYTFGKMDFDIKFDVIDFEIGRNYFISEDLTLRPFYGLKVVWNKQLTTQIFDDFIDNIYYIKNTQKAFGIGFRTGVNSCFKINDNWSLYGNLAFDAISNSVKNFLNSYDDFENPNTLLAQYYDKQVTIQPITEISMGILWDLWSDSQEYHLGVSAGYDFQYWNNNLYSKFPIFSDDNQIIGTERKSGDLSIQGLNIRLRFDF
jgi:hypothetical protein